MPLKNLFGLFLFITLLLTILAVLPACSAPTNTLDLLDPPTNGQVVKEEPDNNPVSSSTPIPATAESDSPQAVSLQDGQRLLDRYCAACHVTSWIEEFEKSHSEWDKVLQQMALLGVKIEESNRDLLLNYLASDDEP